MNLIHATVITTPKYGETLRDTNRYKKINDTLIRQGITAGSGTDSLVIRSKRRLEMVSFHKSFWLHHN